VRARRRPSTAAALKALPVSQAYLDGELYGVRPDGTTCSDMLQAAAHLGREAVLPVASAAARTLSRARRVISPCEKYLFC